MRIYEILKSELCNFKHTISNFLQSLISNLKKVYSTLQILECNKGMQKYWIMIYFMSSPDRTTFAIN